MSILPNIATKSCNKKPRKQQSNKQICKKSAARKRKREQHPNININNNIYSPFGCSTKAIVKPGKQQHHIL